MRRKNLFCVALATLAMASCSNDELVTNAYEANEAKNNAIDFHPMLGWHKLPGTRAGKEESTAANVVKDLSKVRLSIHNTDGTHYKDELGLIKDGSSWKYELEHTTAYWPSNGATLLFYSSNAASGKFNCGHTPSNPGSYPIIKNFTTGEGGISKFYEVVDKPTANARSLSDLRTEGMFDLVGGLTRATHSKKSENSSESNPVILHLQHLLSQVEVQADILQDYKDEYKIYIGGVYIEGVKYSGDFSFGTPYTSDSIFLPKDAGWTPTNDSPTGYYFRNPEVTGDNLEESVIYANAVQLTTSAQSIMPKNRNFMIIPQKVSKFSEENTTGAKIGFMIAIYHKAPSEDGQSWEKFWPLGDTKKATWGLRYVPFAQNFEVGKKYTIKLHFGKGFGDPETQVPDKPDIVDPNPTEPDISDLPISFDVEIDGWTNGGNIDNNLDGKS